MWTLPRDGSECIASVDIMDGFMDCLLVDNLDKEETYILVIFDDENQFTGGAVIRI